MRGILLMVMLAACGNAADESRQSGVQPASGIVDGDVPPAGDMVERPADCGTIAGDSLRAACVAVKAVEKESGMAAQMMKVERTGAGWCVITGPQAVMADGEGAVEVDRAGRVVDVLLTDSAGCPPSRNRG